MYRTVFHYLTTQFFLWSLILTSSLACKGDAYPSKSLIFKFTRSKIRKNHLEDSGYIYELFFGEPINAITHIIVYFNNKYQPTDLHLSTITSEIHDHSPVPSTKSKDLYNRGSSLDINIKMSGKHDYHLEITNLNQKSKTHYKTKSTVIQSTNNNDLFSTEHPKKLDKHDMQMYNKKLKEETKYYIYKFYYYNTNNDYINYKSKFIREQSYKINNKDINLDTEASKHQTPIKQSRDNKDKVYKSLHLAKEINPELSPVPKSKTKNFTDKQYKRKILNEKINRTSYSRTQGKFHPRVSISDRIMLKRNYEPKSNNKLIPIMRKQNSEQIKRQTVDMNKLTIKKLSEKVPYIFNKWESVLPLNFDMSDVKKNLGNVHFLQYKNENGIHDDLEERNYELENDYEKNFETYSFCDKDLTKKDISFYNVFDDYNLIRKTPKIQDRQQTSFDGHNITSKCESEKHLSIRNTSSVGKSSEKYITKDSMNNEDYNDEQKKKFYMNSNSKIKVNRKDYVKYNKSVSFQDGPKSPKECKKKMRKRIIHAYDGLRNIKCNDFKRKTSVEFNGNKANDKKDRKSDNYATSEHSIENDDTTSYGLSEFYEEVKEENNVTISKNSNENKNIKDNKKREMRTIAKIVLICCSALLVLIGIGLLIRAMKKDSSNNK